MRIYTTMLLLFIASLSSLMGQDKRPPLEYIEEAEKFMVDGDNKLAVGVLGECIKHHPGFLEAYTMRGSLREQLGDFDGALTDFSIYLDKFPLHPESLLSRAALRYKIGHYALARDDFQQLLTVSSTETNALFFKQQTAAANDRSPILTTTGTTHHAYVYHFLGLIEMRLQNFEQAVNHFTEAIKLNPSDADSYANRGQAKAMMNDTTAVHDYEMGLKLNPEHAVAQHLLAAWDSKTNSGLSIEERLTRTISLDSTLLYPYLQRGLERLAKQDFAGALVDFDKALTRDMNDPEIWLARGLAREKLSDLDGAYSDYTKAIDLNDSFTKAWINRANVLLKKGRFADAIEDYTVSLIYYPDNAVAYYNRGIAKMQSGKGADACEDFMLASKYGMHVDKKLREKVCH